MSTRGGTFTYSNPTSRAIGDRRSGTQLLRLVFYLLARCNLPLFSLSLHLAGERTRLTQHTVVDRLRQREKSEIEHSSTNVSTKNERVRNGLFTCFLARDAPRHNFRIGVWGEHGRPVGYNSRYSLLLDRGTPYCIGPGPSTAYCLPICALWAAAILSVETGLCCCHDNDFEAEFVALEAFSGPMTSGRARL